MKAPTWFQVAIAQGLDSFWGIGLENQPASDLLAPTIQTWIDDLWPERQWGQVPDTAKIAEAFRKMRVECSRWPTMRDFMRHFPKADPTPQAHRTFEIEWNRNTPKNTSLTAKAHVTYNSLRLKLTVPDWALPASDAESSAIERMIADIHAEQTELAKTVCGTSAQRGRSEARDVGSDQGDAAGPGGVPDGMEGDGRDDWRDSVRRAVGGKWDAYGDGGAVASGASA